MMTESEALKTLEDLQRLLTNYRHISKELTEANGMAIKALEKQIPKKPFVNNRRLQCVNEHNLPIQHYKYCPFCGQKIDWK